MLWSVMSKKQYQPNWKYANILEARIEYSSHGVSMDRLIMTIRQPTTLKFIRNIFQADC